MRRTVFSLALTLSLPLAVTVLATPAFAQDDDLFDDEEPEEAEKPEESSQPTTEDGAVASDSVGGATGFVFKTGLYLTSELGGFVRFGGYGDSTANDCFRCEKKIVSNLQPWIGFTLGYDFLKFLGAEITVGSGFIADAAPIFDEKSSPENHAITMINVGLTGSYYIDRFALTGKAFVGGSLLTPAPFPEALPLGGQAGLGLGVRYATLLTNVVIGLDVTTYVVFSPDLQTADIGPIAIPAMPIMPAFSFAPVIKYTF